MQEQADEQELIRQAMSLIGQRKSEKKTAAVRENGKKGGRPKGTPQSAETKAKIAAARRKQEDPIQEEGLPQEGTTA